MISKLWRGEFALPTAFWLWGVLGGLLLSGFAIALLFAALWSRQLSAFVFLALVLATSGIGYLIAVSTGIWRSAGKYPGSRAWSVSARMALVIVWLAVADHAVFLVAPELYRPPAGPVSASMANEVRDRNASVVDISAFTDFAWTELLVFPPYEHREDICRRLNISGLTCWWNVPRMVKESHCLLVFMNGDSPVHFEHHPHWKNGEFVGYRHPYTAYPKNTVFEVVRRNDWIGFQAKK